MQVYSVQKPYLAQVKKRSSSHMTYFLLPSNKFFHLFVFVLQFLLHEFFQPLFFCLLLKWRRNRWNYWRINVLCIITDQLADQKLVVRKENKY